MLYILYGEDSYSIQQQLQNIKAGLGDQSLLVTNTSTIDGSQVTITQLKMACETVPFLSDKRLVIVSGLLERFELPRQSAKRAKPANLGENTHSSFVSCLKELPPSTVLVLVDGAVKTTNPLFKELARNATVMNFPLLKGEKLAQWVKKKVSQGGSSISPEALSLLINLVGSDLWTMMNEINKLVNYTLGHRIEEDDVRTVVSSAQEISVFALVDAVLDARIILAQQLLQQLLQRSATIQYLLAMLARQIRLVIRSKSLKEEGRNEPEIQRRLGLVSEFALRKTLEQGSRFSWERLIVAHHKLLEADLAVKTGRYEDELALEILVTELCQKESPA